MTDVWYPVKLGGWGVWRWVQALDEWWVFDFRSCLRLGWWWVNFQVCIAHRLILVRAYCTVGGREGGGGGIPKTTKKRRRRKGLVHFHFNTYITVQYRYSWHGWNRGCTNCTVTWSSKQMFEASYCRWDMTDAPSLPARKNLFGSFRSELEAEEWIERFRPLACKLGSSASLS